MEALGLGSLFAGGAGAAGAGLGAPMVAAAAPVAGGLAGSGLGLGGLLGAAGSMIPGAGPIMTLTDLLGPGAVMPSTFKEAFSLGSKVGGTLKDVMGGGGSPAGGAPLVMPTPPAVPQPPEMPGGGGPTPAARTIQSAAGYNAGYTPTADLTLRRMLGR